MIYKWAKAAWMILYKLVELNYPLFTPFLSCGACIVIFSTLLLLLLQLAHKLLRIFLMQVFLNSKSLIESGKHLIAFGGWFEKTFI